jgi:uncharacterized membrane protein
VETTAAERVVFFSDAVVAIAITLLAVDLPVPHTTDSTTNGQLLHALSSQREAYLAFIVSFLVIASSWATHRRVFRYTARANAKTNVLNLGWLLMMILTPFATRLLASDGAFGVRFTIYALIQIIASGCMVLISREQYRARLLRPDTRRSVMRPDLSRNLVFISAFLLSIPVSFATQWAFLVWAAVPMAARVLRAAAR